MYSNDPVVGHIVCGSCALLFVLAGTHKLRARDEFAQTLSAYRVVPARFLSVASIVVPALECLIAASLLIPRAHGGASLAGAALLTVYAGAIGLNLRRGIRELDCGCLGPRGGGVISLALVWRNILVALTLAVVGGIPWSGRPVGWLDVGTVVFAVCVTALLYSAVNGLFAVAARRHPQRG